MSRPSENQPLTFWYSACNADRERYQKDRPSVHFEERASMHVFRLQSCRAAPLFLFFILITRSISRLRARRSNGNSVIATGPVLRPNNHGRVYAHGRRRCRRGNRNPECARLRPIRPREGSRRRSPFSSQGACVSRMLATRNSLSIHTVLVAALGRSYP